jgi:hypothetical protein
VSLRRTGLLLSNFFLSTPQNGLLFGASWIE